MFDFLKAVLVGACASATLGPVLVLILQKTLTYGKRAGVAAGLGSAAVDTLYACVAVFAVTAVQAFIDKNSSVIMIVGGAAIVAVGVFMALRKKFPSRKEKEQNRVSAGHPVEAALLALSNPGALALMFGLMILFKIDSAESYKILLIVGVSAGAVLWWVVFSTIADKLGQRIDMNALLKINRLIGWAVVIFGAVMTIKGIIQLW